VTVFLPHNLADVMGPDDDSPHGRTTRVGSVLSPRSGEVIFRSGIATDLLAHVPSAPRPRPSRVMVSVTGMVTVVAVTVVVMVTVEWSSLGARFPQANECRYSHECTHHAYPLVRKKTAHWRSTKPQGEGDQWRPAA
jgi:hypothetical protein